MMKNKISAFFLFYKQSLAAKIISGAVALVLIGTGIGLGLYFAGREAIAADPTLRTEVIKVPRDPKDPSELPEDEDGDYYDDSSDYDYDDDDYYDEPAEAENNENTTKPSDDSKAPVGKISAATIDTFVKMKASPVSGSELLIYNVDVTTIGADKTGQKDSSAIINAALEAADKAGGGTVYLPAGRYRLNDGLIVSDKVSLVGDWRSPEDGGGKNEGTIIMVYFGRGNNDDYAVSPVTVEGTVKNISFWYPQQNPDNIVAYPYTITSRGPAVIKNITFYNSYKAINAANATCVRVRDIFGTVLKVGINTGEAYDVPRYERIRFDTTFWSRSGLKGCPSSAATIKSLNKYVRYHLDGFILGRLDWGFFYDIKVSQAYRAVYTVDANLAFGKVEFENVEYGFYLQQCAWLQLTDSKLNARITPIYNISCPLLISTTTFTASPDIPQYSIMSGGTNATINDCTFEDWGEVAIKHSTGPLIVSNSTFKAKYNTGEEYITTKGTNNQYNGNIFGDTPTVTGITQGTVNVPHVPEYEDHEFAQAGTPAKQKIYNVKDYGAVTLTGIEPMDGEKLVDASVIIQKVLDIAGRNGGGYVVVPGGSYIMEHPLVVPAGVELRGMMDMPANTGVGGTMFYIYADRGKSSGAFITMGQNSGVRGIQFYYPQQGFTDKDKFSTMYNRDEIFYINGAETLEEGKAQLDEYYYLIEYPPTIKMNKNTWAVNLSMGNSYVAIDAMTNVCDNAIISEIHGMAYNTFVKIGHGSKDVVLQDVQCNTTANKLGQQAKNIPFRDELANRYLNFSVIGDAPGLKYFNCFNIFAKTCINLVKDSYTGKSFEGQTYMVAFDWNRSAVYIEKGAEPKFDTINSMYVVNATLPEKAEYGYVLKTADDYTGNPKVNFYNGYIWGTGSQIACVTGGAGEYNFIQFMSKNNCRGVLNEGTGEVNIYSYILDAASNFMFKGKAPNVFASYRTATGQLDNWVNRSN